MKRTMDERRRVDYNELVANILGEMACSVEMESFVRVFLVVGLVCEVLGLQNDALLDAWGHFDSIDIVAVLNKLQNSEGSDSKEIPVKKGADDFDVS